MRPVRTILIAVGVLCVTAAIRVEPVLAENRSGGAFLSSDGDPTAEASESTNAPGSPGGGAPSACTWRVLNFGNTVFDENGDPITSPTGRWLQKVCDGSPVPINGVFAIPERPPVDPTSVARRARESVPIPDPALSTSPPADGRLYARMPVWLWLDPAWWKTYSATADTGGVSATVVAKPVRAIWTMGDGGTTTCTGPGVAWRRGLPESATTCSYLYKHSSSITRDGTFTISVRVEFEVSWSASTGSGGTLPALARTTSRAVQVGEIQAVETG